MNTHETEQKLDYVRIDTDRTALLHDYPSHRDSRHGPVSADRGVGWHRAGVVLAVLFAVIVGVAGIGFAVVTQSGVLERVADNTLRRMVPPHLAAELGPTDVRVSWPPRLAVTYSDVALRPAGADPAAAAEPLAAASSLAVIIDPVSLLDGTPRIGGIELVGLRTDWSGWTAPDEGPGGGDAPNEGEPWRLSDTPEGFDALFAGLRAWGAVHLYQEGDLRVAVSDTRIALPDNAYGRTLTIDRLDGEAVSGTARVEGTIGIDADVVEVEGELTVPPADRRGTASLELTLDGLPIPWRRLPTMMSDVRADHEPDASQPPAPTLTTVQMSHHGPERADNVLRIEVEPRDLSFKLAADDFLPFTGQLVLDYGFDDEVVTLEADRWQWGRSSALVSARIRDAGAPASGTGKGPFLMPVEFEALANAGRMAPGDSPVTALDYAARARGTFDFTEQRFNFTAMEIETRHGEIVAEGQINLAAPLPTAVFHMETADVPTHVIKQFWPASVARAARRWFLDNLAGGRVVSATFDIAEPLRRRVPGTDQRLHGDTIVDLAVEGVRFDITGELPPVRDAVGRVRFADQMTTINLDAGTVFLPSGRTATARDGVMTIMPPDAEDRVRALVDVHVEGDADAIGEVITYHPIDAKRFRDYDEADLSGTVDAHIRLDFSMNPEAGGAPPNWDVDLAIADGAMAEPFDGRLLSGLDGVINVTPERADLDMTGFIDGLPARIDMVLPFAESGIDAETDIALSLGDADRARLAPGLETMLRGATPVTLEGDGERVSVEADLTAAQLMLPWIGWSKGAGVDARAAFDLVIADGRTTLDDFRLEGTPFAARGQVDLTDDGLVRARFGSLRLNTGDDIAVDITRQGAGYAIDVDGSSLDARALIRHVRRQIGSGEAGGDVPVTVNARVDVMQGFGGEVLRNAGVNLRLDVNGIQTLSFTGETQSGMPFSIALEGQGTSRQLRIEAFDAGELLRFLDVYGQVYGGILNAALTGDSADSMAGPVQLVDFRVLNEPRLAQLANQRGRDGSQSLREAVQRDIDTSDVRFDIAQGLVRLSPAGVDLSEGIVRGPLVGFALSGRVTDSAGNMRLTGTFMPAYGLNSLFADIPLVGLILGNGRDRGLIGVTFKLEGPADGPQVSINPLSIIAPGLFRSIFEFR